MPPRRAVVAAAVLLAAVAATGCAGNRRAAEPPPLVIRPIDPAPAAGADGRPADPSAPGASGAAAMEPEPEAAPASAPDPGEAASEAASAAAAEPGLEWGATAEPRTPADGEVDVEPAPGRQEADLPADPAEPGDPPVEPHAAEVPPQGDAGAAERKPTLHELCHESPAEGGFLEESRRLLGETFCGATLWFDGLFGGDPDIHNARAVSGRVELSALHTDFEGFDYKGRLRINYDLPNLERRVRLFLGREEDDQFVADRQEGFAIRSSVFGLEGEEEWLAGLGYSPPGRYLSKFDVRVGGRIKSAPEVFTQLRYRQNVFVGERDVWRFRETAFYENRDGFGSTTSLDWDRVLRRDLVLRWGSVGTISEATEGVAWRSAVLVYHNLGRWEHAAVAGELFVRGETDAEVPLREYGARAIFRQPLGRQFLFGEAIVGYSWPRQRAWQDRDGSAMIGFGIELLFGRDPY